MDPLDLLIVGAAALAALGGYRLGFFTRVLSWVGLGGGIYVAAHFAPRIVRAAGLSTAGGRLVLASLLLVVGAFVGQAAGMLAGSRLHAGLPAGPLRVVDRVVGGAVGLAGVVAALWLLLPAVSSVAGWPARATSRSAISRWISNELPPPPDTVESLGHLVGGYPFPEVFAALQPAGPAGRPPTRSPLGGRRAAEVASSTVRVEGDACDRIEEGSGFAVGADLVVTNAHVVAGEPPGATDVVVPSGATRPARVVAFDPARDVALLRVSGLDERPLRLGSGSVGASGVVLGHPRGQVALAVVPVRVSQEITATGRDLYDRHDVARDVYVLAAALAPGDSGGALVDRSGRVVGVAFAIALERADTAYALTSAEIRPVLDAPRSGRAVSTQACLQN